MNQVLRKIIKTKRHFPTKDASMKMLWFALRNAEKKWTYRARYWPAALHQFAIYFPNQVPLDPGTLTEQKGGSVTSPAPPYTEYLTLPGHLFALISHQRLAEMLGAALYRRLANDKHRVGAMTVGEENERHEAGPAFGERPGRCLVLAHDQIAVPMTGHGTILHGSRTFRDRAHVTDLAHRRRGSALRASPPGSHDLGLNR